MKQRAPQNRTLTLTKEEEQDCARQLLTVQKPLALAELQNRIIHGDLLEVVDFLPEHFVDLLILDPPYNLDKNFSGTRVSKTSDEDYLAFLESWFPRLLRLLAPQATVYLCGDWRSSTAQYQLLSKYLHVQNRITWQREKGRGARYNWKNACEDIWFATVQQKYYFNVDAVKLKRRVLAPYRENGTPKDWTETGEGKFRMTCPSNYWDDISIPFWSMPENTDHPTQKPEKLIAKLILASSRPGDFVFDPFLGSGTTAVVAQKLGRHFAGIEQNLQYCCWAQARLQRVKDNPTIQGYADGVFWERNSCAAQQQTRLNH